MEKKCQHCKKDFEAKKDTAKYCSVSCRVMYSRKNKGNKKMEAEKSLLLQTQVLLNSVVEMVGKVNFGQVPTILDAPRVTDLRRDEPPQYESSKTKTFRSQDYFTSQIMKGVCEDVDGHRRFLEELNESNLPNHVKQQLIAASRVNQS